MYICEPTVIHRFLSLPYLLPPFFLPPSAPVGRPPTASRPASRLIQPAASFDAPPPSPAARCYESALSPPDSSPPLLLCRPHSVGASTRRGSTTQFITPSFPAPYHPTRLVAALPYRLTAPAVAMSSRKTSRAKTGFFGIRAKPSGNFRVEFSDAGRRFWLDTYTTTHKAIHAYNVAVWHVGRPKKYLNFPEIKTQAAAVFLMPGGIHMQEITTNKKKKRPAIVKKKKKKENNADPMTVIPVESSEEDWGDLTEEDEVCDDPDKDAFWE
ncbi:ap2-containing protein [Hordeum vulgare]|nr:ap2-containing protein [Hordeum vulgare]